MDLATPIRSLLQHFHGFISPGERLFVGYLAASLLILLVVQWRQASYQHGGWRRFFPPEIWWHPSARLDYRFFLVNKVLIGLLILPLALKAYPLILDAVRQLLATHFHSPQWPASFPMVGLYTLGAVMAMDFGVFLSHYLQHRIPWLWEFHKVHHSAEVMTPLTAYRMHPLDDLGAMLLSGACSGLFAGVGSFLFQASPTVFTVLGLNVVLFGFYLLGFHLRHSHVWISFGPLDQIFVSPSMHQIHHSSDPRHFDRNFGLVFSLWDRGFGTAWLPREREVLQYGLSRSSNREYTSLLRLYGLPFLKIARRLRLPYRLGWLGVMLPVIWLALHRLG